MRFVEKRKVIDLRGILGITLPNWWTRGVGIKAGNIVNLVLKENEAIIQLSREEKKSSSKQVSDDRI